VWTSKPGAVEVEAFSGEPLAGGPGDGEVMKARFKVFFRENEGLGGVPERSPP